MFCPKCGDQVEQNEFYCNKCGNYLGNNNINNIYNSVSTSTNVGYESNNQFNNYQSTNKSNTESNNKKMILVGIVIGLVFFLIIFLIVFFVNKSKDNYYFSNNNYEDSENIVSNSNTSSSTQKKGKYSTVIITDNTYSGVKIEKEQDAYDLISEDSVVQKDNCPSEIMVIENEIINKYGVTAVNLCEMDIEFAREIENVFETIYKEYPSAREHLTNLSLINGSISDSYIAAFMPVFSFATSDSSSTYPWVIKTQVLLNTMYFLNTTRLEASVTDGSNSGHFPPNATKYSPVAHELGHYLSFMAMMKSYELDSILLVNNNNVDVFYDVYSDFADGDFSLLMITEAYNNYKNEVGTTLDIDAWRETISKYAVAKDNSGEYIYDETIAEAFHDVYLNGDNAAPASKYVVKVLKEKLEG